MLLLSLRGNRTGAAAASPLASEIGKLLAAHINPSPGSGRGMPCDVVTARASTARASPARLLAMPRPKRPAPGGEPSTWPRCAASAAVLRGREVLLVERAKGALAGYWSLPGGHIEPGETARSAALREVREETGVEA